MQKSANVNVYKKYNVRSIPLSFSGEVPQPPPAERPS